MASIQIIVGTVMGTALDVAKSAKGILEAHGDEVVLHENFNADAFNPSNPLLLCTSNTGMGDLPANIVPFLDFLKSQCPPIYQTPYGLINLGDSNYPNFAQAGHTLDEAMIDLGARRLGDVFVMDASEIDDHEEASTAFINTWRQLLDAVV